MGTVELKNMITQYMSTADDKLLRIVKTIFETYQKSNEIDFFDDLPLEIQEILIESREDIKKSNYFSNADVSNNKNKSE